MGASADNESLTHADAVRLAHRYVAAYNDRDLEATLALQHENVVSYPSRIFGHRRITGRGDVRAWWEAMATTGRRYEVVDDVRQLGPDRVAISARSAIRASRSVRGAWSCASATG